MTTGVHVFIPINIFAYSLKSVCKLPHTVRFLCGAKGLDSCTHMPTYKVIIKLMVYISKKTEQGKYR